MACGIVGDRYRRQEADLKWGAYARGTQQSRYVLIKLDGNKVAFGRWSDQFVPGRASEGVIKRAR